jgi:hypothetical protein
VFTVGILKIKFCALSYLAISIIYNFNCIKFKLLWASLTILTYIFSLKNFLASCRTGKFKVVLRV